ncbi:DUF2332 domain-containing protein [Paracoccus alkanivorans]|uniref:DUF2332 domain-containing protein n=1 Tax=Paracoccus alkanivorans TaxID=2116655 RepID=A0A3M0MJI6_9RHOB|nr:DUF2332 domain-containing protein [Paracoccus alkanivorans]RMC37615.1 DUF2332 domain-containing protein [Paracoccus alkanivorans]
MTAAGHRESFRKQAIACRALGSPLTAEICEILAETLQEDQGEVAHRILNWPGDSSPRADAVPLRLCGGLHALVLTGADKTLAAAYADARPTAGILLQAIARHEDHLLGWLQGPPQTNEVGRAAAIIAAARFATGQCPLPIRALELGASAGLNLNFHRYDLNPKGVLPPSGPDSPGIFLEEEGLPRVVLRPDWTGEMPRGDIKVTEAEGVDLRPVDPVGDELRLLAYCWAGQPERMARLRAALAIARRYPPRVTEGDAAGWLETRLAQPAPERMTLVYHTIAWQYFPPATRAVCEAALQTAGAQATCKAPLAHFSMEGDGGIGGDGAALTLRLWNGRLRAWKLGRVDFHGRWIRWQPTAL